MSLRSLPFLLCAVAFGLSGCGSSHESAAPACLEGTVAKPDGGCTEPCPSGLSFDVTRGSCAPILPDGECPPGTMPMIGKKECQPVGVLTCAEGFVADGAGGCNAVLPDTPCPEGNMAVPGEKKCREVAPCGSGTFGDIPVEPSTLYVDASYVGGGSDGSKAKPFTAIQPAIDAAGSTNPIIAVAAGAYTGNVRVTHPVRIFGRCPSMVEVRGVAPVVDGAIAMSTPGEVTIRALAVTGPDVAIIAQVGTLRLERIWVHDSGARAIYAAGNKTSLLVSGSLLERNTEIGISVWGSKATIEGTVVRDTRPRADKKFGRGISVTVNGSQPAELIVRGSLVERNVENGIAVFGSSAHIEASVIRDTQPRASDLEQGVGIAAELDRATERPAELVVIGSLVDRNTGTGIYAAGSTVTIDSTVVRDTRPQASDKLFGRGIQAIADVSTKLRTTLVVRTSLVERNVETGIALFGSIGTVETTIVRDTQPSVGEKKFGRGIDANVTPGTLQPSEIVVRASLVERSAEIGISVNSSIGTIETTTVRDTRPATDGRFGDGIVCLSTYPNEALRSSMTVSSSIVMRNARVGIGAYGSDLSLNATLLVCNLGGDLDEEPLGPPRVEAKIEDGGGNLCGCDGALQSCIPQTSSLEPPPAPPTR